MSPFVGRGALGAPSFRRPSRSGRWKMSPTSEVGGGQNLDGVKSSTQRKEAKFRDPEPSWARSAQPARDMNKKALPWQTVTADSIPKVWPTRLKTSGPFTHPPDRPSIGLPYDRPAKSARHRRAAAKSRRLASAFPRAVPYRQRVARAQPAQRRGARRSAREPCAAAAAPLSRRLEEARERRLRALRASRVPTSVHAQDETRCVSRGAHRCCNTRART